MIGLRGRDATKGLEARQIRVEGMKDLVEKV